MQNELMEKYIRISRIIITILVFIVLNIWFIFENDPHLILALIISMTVFIINSLNSKICRLLIYKGDRITSKLLKVLYYSFVLPIIFLLFLIVFGLLGTFIVGIFEFMDLLNLGLAVLIAFTGIGIFTCVLVPYFQTLIILILRCFLKSEGDYDKEK